MKKQDILFWIMLITIVGFIAFKYDAKVKQLDEKNAIIVDLKEHIETGCK